FPVRGMTCDACVASVESMLKTAPGVKDAAVNLANQSAQVIYDESENTPEGLRKVVQSIGYDLLIDVEDPEAEQEQLQQREYQRLKTQTLWALILSAPVVVIGMSLLARAFGSGRSLIRPGPVVSGAGRRCLVPAWEQARAGWANLGPLVGVRSGIAFVFRACNAFYP